MKRMLGILLLCSCFACSEYSYPASFIGKMAVKVPRAFCTVALRGLSGVRSLGSGLTGALVRGIRSYPKTSIVLGFYGIFGAYVARRKIKRSVKPALDIIQRSRLNPVNYLLLNGVANNSINEIKAACLLGACVDVRNRGGDSALYIAASQGYLRIVQYLVHKGADVDGNSITRNESAVEVALNNGFPEIANYLYDREALAPQVLIDERRMEEERRVERSRAQERAQEESIGRALDLLEHPENIVGRPQDVTKAQDCSLCLTTANAADLWQPSCGHAICYTCFADQLRTAYRNRAISGINRLMCAKPGCEHEFDRKDIMHFAVNNQDIGILYDKVECAAQGARNCPTRECQAMFVYDVSRGAYSMRCPDCNRVYCAACSLDHTEFITCDQARERELRRQQGTDAATERLIRQITKKCPRCHAPIQKNEGCNHMTCRRPGCGYQFCWTCLGPNRGKYGDPCSSSTCRTMPGYQIVWY